MLIWRGKAKFQSLRVKNLVPQIGLNVNMKEYGHYIEYQMNFD